MFTRVLGLCVENGMVSGHTQAIDSAPVKANASMDTVELKVPENELDEHLRKVRAISAVDREVPHRKSKGDRSDKGERGISANENELNAIKGRNRKWGRDQDQRPGAGNKGSKYTSNKTHYGPTDPDARISVKPGKARKLNYLSQLSVDTANHVITDIRAYHADGKDNQQLQDIVRRLQGRLWQQGLVFENCVADTGYSSGENYAFLEDRKASFRPMARTREARTASSMLKRRTTICALKGKYSRSKKCSWTTVPRPGRKRTAHRARSARAVS